MAKKREEKQHVVKHKDEIEIHPQVFEPGRLPTESRTTGQKYADALTSLMGSWFFIVMFMVILVLWICVNFYGWVNSWDPYPFILLNLVLSCLAAIQAPIILMSQNRAEQKDRMRQEYDYRINRKSLHQINDVLKEITYLRSDLNQLKKKKKR